MASERITPEDLRKLVANALERSGATVAMAEATARALIAAEEEGLASHGVSRVPQYCGHLKNGRATGSAVPVVRRDSGGACLVDAGQGLAFEACRVAAREALARARKHGVA